jgi:hypothetical protein
VNSYTVPTRGENATGRRSSAPGKTLWINDLDGAPGVTRTRDLLIRSQTLYPTELRAHPVRYSKLQQRTPLRNIQFPPVLPGLVPDSGYIGGKRYRMSAPFRTRRFKWAHFAEVRNVRAGGADPHRNRRDIEFGTNTNDRLRTWKDSP